MMVARRRPGAGVRRPPREETAGGVTKLRVRRYGDLDAGGLLPRWHPEGHHSVSVILVRFGGLSGSKPRSRAACSMVT
jgi:hypothetical protein